MGAYTARERKYIGRIYKIKQKTAADIAAAVFLFYINLNKNPFLVNYIVNMNYQIRRYKSEQNAASRAFAIACI